MTDVKRKMASDISKQQEHDITGEHSRRHSTGDTHFKNISPHKRAPSAGLRIFSPVDSDDLEVETVLGDGG